MKFHLTFLLFAGVLVAFVAAAPKKKTDDDEGDSQWLAFIKMIYKQVCKADGENRCIELTKETYQSVLQPYRPKIKAKCKEYKAAGQFYLHWPCIALIKTIPKDDE